MSSQTQGGWRWLEKGAPPDADDPAAAGQEEAEIARHAARCFQGDSGERTLAHLARLTIDRCLGPNASEAQLRHLEGQRALVFHLLGLIARGRDGR